MKKGNAVFKEACDKIGGQRKMADALGVDETFVSNVIHGRKRLPESHGLRIEELTGISRKKLYPETYKFYWRDL